MWKSKVSPPRFTLRIHLPLVLTAALLLVTSCSKESNNFAVAPGLVHSSDLNILDTTITLRAQFSPADPIPDLILHGTLRLETHADSATIEGYSVLCRNAFDSSPMLNRKLSYAQTDTLVIDANLKDIAPFSERPPIVILLNCVTHENLRDSLLHIAVPISKDIDWQGVTEPGLRPISPPQGMLGFGFLWWTHRGDALYFDGILGTNYTVMQYILADSSFQQVSLPSNDVTMADIASDDNSLLLAGPIVQSSSLFIYDLGAHTTRKLVTLPDSVYVTRSKLSPDGSRVIISSYRLAPVVTEYPIWLFSIADSTLTKLQALDFLTAYGGVRTLDWMPHSNETFFFNNGQEFTIYSIPTGAMYGRVLSDSMFYWKILGDGFSLLGLRWEQVVGGGIVEVHSWISDIVGGSFRQLTFTPEIIYEPSLSPDGRHLAMTSWRDNKLGLWMKEVSGIMGPSKPAIPPQRNRIHGR